MFFYSFTSNRFAHFWPKNEVDIFLQQNITERVMISLTDSKWTERIIKVQIFPPLPFRERALPYQIPPKQVAQALKLNQNSVSKESNSDISKELYQVVHHQNNMNKKAKVRLAPIFEQKQNRICLRFLQLKPFQKFREHFKKIPLC